jgi:hypothetical protein
MPYIWKQRFYELRSCYLGTNAYNARILRVLTLIVANFTKNMCVTCYKRHTLGKFIRILIQWYKSFDIQSMFRWSN